MANKYPESDPITETLDKFSTVEQEIHSYFDTIISTATITRDELLQQLVDLKQDYLNKEELRKKQVRELEQMIEQFNVMKVQQNLNLKLHDEYIKNTKKELAKAEKPISVNVPTFNAENVQPLLQLFKVRNAQEINTFFISYSNKADPFKSIGKKGSLDGEFHHPLGVAIDKDEIIYVCDSVNKKIQIFNGEGKYVRKFGGDCLSYPHDIVLDDRWAFISDGGLDSILKFGISDFKLIGKSGRGLSYPYGLTVDRNLILIADCLNNRIAILNQELEFCGEFGKGALKKPYDVKVNQNKIFVLDSNKHNNVHVFNKSADLLYSMINVKFGSGFMFMCLDQLSNVIVSSSKGRSIQIFTLEGHLMHSIQCEGSPRGVAVAKNSNIVCAMSNSIKFY